jgi:hypothetical protein
VITLALLERETIDKEDLDILLRGEKLPPLPPPPEPPSAPAITNKLSPQPVPGAPLLGTPPKPATA